MEVNGGSGGGTFTDSSVTLTMPEADVNIVLYFEEIPKYSIWVDADPEEVEDIYVSGTGVETTSDGYLAPEGTVITLSYIMANDDYAFDHYIVNGTAITGNTFTLTGNTHVVASCRSLWHDINVATDPAGIGTVIVTSSDPDALNDYGGSYDCLEGTTVTLSVPSGDWEGEYRLVGYRIGGTLHSGSTYTCTVTSDMTVTAVFESKYHDMFITTEGGANYVSPTYEPDMEEDESLNITWEPSEGYQFSHWTVTDAKSYTLNGDNSGGTVVMGTKDVYVVVYFERIPGYYTIDVEPENYGYGVTFLSASIAQVGETVTVTANPYTGYHFVSMVIDGVTYTDASVTIVMPAHDVTGTVYFEPD
jgi:hypothetical protein